MLFQPLKILSAYTNEVTSRMDGAGGRPAWVRISRCFHVMPRFSLKLSTGMAFHHRRIHDHRHCDPSYATAPELPATEQAPVLVRRSSAVSRKPYMVPLRDLFPCRKTLIVIQEWRIRKENAGIPDDDMESVWWGLKQALRDLKLYMFTVQQMALITAQSFNNFFPSIVGTLGYSKTVTLLLTAPPYLFAFIVSLCVSFHAAHTHERGWHISIPMIFALLGNLLVCFTHQLPLTHICQA